VIPQQSLRSSIERVFRRISGLERIKVLNPFTVGDGLQDFYILIVDEAHRLNRLAPQAHPTLNNRFREINAALYGGDGVLRDQLDWMRSRSRHQILLVDPLQSVSTADLSAQRVREVTTRARKEDRLYTLRSQMRISAEEDFVGYVRDVLAVRGPDPKTFAGYDLRLFDNFDEMFSEISAKERRYGLSGLVAGCAWPWVSRKAKETPDIHLGSHALFWNRTDKDWISSPTSPEEVGSIHTVQGYDLNYAGVIFGPDVSFDPTKRSFRFHRSSFYDRRAAKNNGKLGLTFSDDEILGYVPNVYGVLMTRGVRGTFVYACDSGLREYLSEFFLGGLTRDSRLRSMVLLKWVRGPRRSRCDSVPEQAVLLLLAAEAEDSQRDRAVDADELALLLQCARDEVVGCRVPGEVGKVGLVRREGCDAAGLGFGVEFDVVRRPGSGEQQPGRSPGLETLVKQFAEHPAIVRVADRVDGGESGGAVVGVVDPPGHV
jgi:DUF2075 family protein